MYPNLRCTAFFKLVLVISCKGAVKIFQAYESILHDIQSNIKYH
jgi:hypothetical protein